MCEEGVGDTRTSVSTLASSAQSPCLYNEHYRGVHTLEPVNCLFAQLLAKEELYVSK